MGLGHLGVPWGWVSWGVRRWGCHLGLDGVLVTLDAVSLAAACGAAGDACCRDVGCQPGGPYCCSGVGSGGGGFGGSGGALPPGWGYGWAWGAWVLVGVPPGAMGWCMRFGPGSGVGVFDASVPPQGGSNRGGCKRPYLGVLLSYVVWELNWMMGWGWVVFSSACGSGGPRRAAMGPGPDGPGPPALGDLGVTGVPMGSSGGAGSPEGGGILPPLMLSSHP